MYHNFVNNLIFCKKIQVSSTKIKKWPAILTYFTSEQILPIAIAGENSGEKESNLKSVNKSHLNIILL